MHARLLYQISQRAHLRSRFRNLWRIAQSAQSSHEISDVREISSGEASLFSTCGKMLFLRIWELWSCDATDIWRLGETLVSIVFSTTVWIEGHSQGRYGGRISNCWRES